MHILVFIIIGLTISYFTLTRIVIPLVVSEKDKTLKDLQKKLANAKTDKEISSLAKQISDINIDTINEFTKNTRD